MCQLWALHVVTKRQIFYIYNCLTAMIMSVCVSL